MRTTALMAELERGRERIASVEEVLTEWEIPVLDVDGRAWSLGDRIGEIVARLIDTAGAEV